MTTESTNHDCYLSYVVIITDKYRSGQYSNITFLCSGNYEKYCKG